MSSDDDVPVSFTRFMREQKGQSLKAVEQALAAASDDHVSEWLRAGLVISTRGRMIEAGLRRLSDKSRYLTEEKLDKLPVVRNFHIKLSRRGRKLFGF